MTLNYTLHSRSKRLLRSVISIQSCPESEHGHENFIELQNSGLKFTDPEDVIIFDYLEKFYNIYSAPPLYSLIVEYFEQHDNIEVVSRLEEISKAECLVKTNFQAVLKAEVEEQEIRREELILKDTASILRNKRELTKKVGDKTTFQGIADAREYYEYQISNRPITGTCEKFDPLAYIKNHKSQTKYLIKHFGLTSGRPNILSAYAGLSKTYLAIELAVAVAAGRSTVWGGLHLSLSGPVVYLDYEMGSDDLYQRFQRVAFGLDIDLENLRPRPRPENQRQAIENCIDPETNKPYPNNDDYLKIKYRPSFSLASSGAKEKLISLCRGKALLIIDNFRAATTGQKIEENSSEIRIYLDLLTDVSDETKTVIFVIHHDRKDGKEQNTMRLQSMRGSSGIADAANATIHICKAPNDNKMSISQGKASKNSGEDVYFRLEDVGEMQLVPGTQDVWISPGIRIVRAEKSNLDTQFEQDILIVTKAIADVGHVGSYKELSNMGIGISSARTGQAIRAMRDRGILDNSEKSGYKLAPSVTAEDLI